MSPDGSVKKLPLVAFTLAVCFAGVVVGAAWGAAAGNRLLQSAISGGIFGATTGLLAAATWCRFMVPLIARAKRPHMDIIGYGLKWGAVMGAAAGIVVFVWLILNVINTRPGILRRTPMLLSWAASCAAFGGCVGMLTGYLCGWLGWLTARASLPLPPLNPKNHPQQHITPLTHDHPASPPSHEPEHDAHI